MSSAKPTDWQTAALPAQRTTIPLDRTFSSAEMAHIRRGLVPFQMEDKWFIYWQDGALYFHRSWTGFCIYVVHFAAAAGGCKMLSADVNRDPAQYKETSSARDAAMISYLVDLLLLRQPSTFPTGSSSPETQALETWSQVGRTMLDQHPDDE